MKYPGSIGIATQAYFGSRGHSPIGAWQQRTVPRLESGSRGHPAPVCILEKKISDLGLLSLPNEHPDISIPLAPALALALATAPTPLTGAGMG